MTGSRAPSRAAWTLLGAALAAPSASLAAGRYVEDVLVSRSGRAATVEIALACSMRLESDVATDGGTAVEIHLRPLDGCRQLGGDGLASEEYHPVGADQAGLTQVEYESLGIGENILVLRFGGSVAYRVAQRADLRSVEVMLQLPETFTEGSPTSDAGAAGSVAATAPPSAAGGATRASSAAASASSGARSQVPGRRPLTVRVREPQTASDYIVNLESTRVAPSRALLAALPVPSDSRLYVSDIVVDGAVWHRLRLGFFASEAAARAALTPLVGRFPKAWIGRAEPQEVAGASSEEFARGGVVMARPAAGTSAGTAVGAAAPASAAAGLAAAPSSAASALATSGLPAATQPPAGAGPLTEARAAELFSKAHDAVLDADFPAAIRLYTELLGASERAADARELLGVVFEKSGQPEQAQAEYRAYLERYPSAPGAARVRQRLDGLLTAGTAPAAPLRRAVDATAPPGETGDAGAGAGKVAAADRAGNAAGRRPESLEEGATWNVTTGISQYYERNVDQLDPSQDQVVTLSALVSDLDLDVVRTGGNLDVRSRVTLNHVYDLMGQDLGFGRSGDQTRLYYAYSDVGAAGGDWSVRLGRQSLHHWGVLGRFDGAHFSYAWAPNRRVHVTAGYPVESPYDSLTSARRFEGLAVDFDKLAGAWNVSAFLNRQTIGSIDDRRAAGFEVAYLDARRSLNTIVDYDLDYSTLNTVLALGTWRLKGRATLSALVDLQMSPILTTRNALIGQPVTSIDDLLLTYTEDEVRRLALDRTAESKTVTLGIATPLGQRFQLNADVTAAAYGGTAASGGVPAIPDMGNQIFYSTTLVGSGLFGGRDVSIFGLRYGEADTFTTSQASWDTRFALGRNLRIDPRVQYAIWESRTDGSRRETLNPSLRLLLNLRRRYRLELEVGRNQITRTRTGDVQVTSGNYLNLGYRADF